MCALALDPEWAHMFTVEMEIRWDKRVPKDQYMLIILITR